MTCDDGAVSPFDADAGALAVLPEAFAEAVCFDCQATGATPAHGHLLELAWSGPEGSADHVVALPDGHEIPRRVASLTGLGPEDLAGAPAPAWVRERLRQSLSPGLLATAGPRPVACPLPLGATPRALVVHFAQFERRWLLDLFGSLPAPVICTHEIARRLYPDLPSRGLRALAGYLGYDAPELKRSADHVAATRFIWAVIARRLVGLGVRDVPALQNWVAQTPVPSRNDRFVYRVPRERRLAVPDAPGVYRFLGAQGEVLYVGKATSLKSRVNSYFQKRTGRADHKMELVTRAHDLEVTPTGSPLQAALLETDEIKRHDPVCNRALRARGRAPVWTSLDLLEVSCTPDEAHPIGPLPRPCVQAGRLVRGSTDAAELFAWGERWAPDAPIFEAGLALFRQRHRVTTVAELRRLGAALWAGRTDEVEEEIEAVPVRGWSPETVCESLLDLTRSTALSMRRAFWFGQIDGAEVQFAATHDRSPQAVTLRPVPGLPAIADYDRLRVLTTELRRVLGVHDDVAMRLRCGRVLDAGQLRAALAWV